MQIYPAIDLQANCCVRLYQGEFSQATYYSSDPVAVAEQFAAAGAKWLHIIDLDAAKNPAQNQYELVAAIIKQMNLNVQIGGGIRAAWQIERLLNLGVQRVIVGSLAIHDAATVKQWLQHYGSERIVLALDIKILADNNAYVCTQGWQTVTESRLNEVIRSYKTVGMKHLLCTDISRDGALTGPNFALYEALITEFPELQLQASGGIAHLTDLQQLRTKQLAGAVLGRALYENKFTLAEALTC